MVTCYFVLGTVIILSLNSWIGNFAEAFWAGVASILGGVADSVFQVTGGSATVYGPPDRKHCDRAVVFPCNYNYI